MRLAHLASWLLCTALLLVACGPEPDDDDTSSDDDDATAEDLPPIADLELEGTCPLADRYGSFIVETNPDYSVVQGQVSDGVVPVTILETTLQDDHCVLLKRNNPFCDPSCSPGFTCDFDGECIEYPVPQDLGTVVVDGLVQAVSMEPVQPGFNYFDTSLPLESMVVDGSVRLRSGQGTWAPFELWGAGVEDLTLSGEKFWTFTEGEPLEITWEPPASVGRGEIHLGVNIDQHGTSPTTLYCTFPDTGSATLPADMIEGLFEAGVTGWPVGSVRRRTADRADVGEGCVDLVVSSFESVEVVVAGYIPCDNAHPCPDGMECNYEIELCE